MNFVLNEEEISERLDHGLIYQTAGKITKSLGLVFEAHLPGAAVGSLCSIQSHTGWIDGEVIGFKDKRVMLMPYDDAHGIHQESLVHLKELKATIPVSDSYLGRVIDGKGAPLDDLGPLIPEQGSRKYKNLYQTPPDPMKRTLVCKPLDLGVRAINGLMTTGQGQRIGIMAGSGVGKSVLLGMMARYTSADVNVIALVGERGREVREFIERDLGPEGLKRSVVVIATSDRSPLLRVRAAFMAATIAEYFREQGKSVLLLMDSITRFCMAQREIGLAMGEPPASKGYTPSVFSLLPKLLERSGTAPNGGSITGLYTVLVEGDDLDDPVADSSRSVLDGHIVLSRKIAQQNHWPAIDVLASISRVMPHVADSAHLKWANTLRQMMATYSQVEDLVNIGAYAKGTNPRIDQAIAMQERIKTFLKQAVEEKSSFKDTLQQMQALCQTAEAFLSTQSVQQQPVRL